MIVIGEASKLKWGLNAMGGAGIDTTTAHTHTPTPAAFNLTCTPTQLTIRSLPQPLLFMFIPRRPTLTGTYKH